MYGGCRGEEGGSEWTGDGCWMEHAVFRFGARSLFSSSRNKAGVSIVNVRGFLLAAEPSRPYLISNQGLKKCVRLGPALLYPRFLREIIAPQKRILKVVS